MGIQPPNRRLSHCLVSPDNYKTVVPHPGSGTYSSWCELLRLLIFLESPTKFLYTENTAKRKQNTLSQLFAKYVQVLVIRPAVWQLFEGIGRPSVQCNHGEDPLCDK